MVMIEPDIKRVIESFKISREKHKPKKQIILSSFFQTNIITAEKAYKIYEKAVKKMGFELRKIISQKIIQSANEGKTIVRVEVDFRLTKNQEKEPLSPYTEPLEDIIAELTTKGYYVHLRAERGFGLNDALLIIGWGNEEQFNKIIN